jgi:hypothetical protein
MVRLDGSVVDVECNVFETDILRFEIDVWGLARSEVAVLNNPPHQEIDLYFLDIRWPNWFGQVLSLSEMVVVPLSLACCSCILQRGAEFLPCNLFDKTWHSIFLFSFPRPSPVLRFPLFDGSVLFLLSILRDVPIWHACDEDSFHRSLDGQAAKCCKIRDGLK